MAGIILTSQSQQTANGKLIKVAEWQGSQQRRPGKKEFASTYSSESDRIVSDLISNVTIT
jgi:hypothetical protein